MASQPRAGASATFGLEIPRSSLQGLHSSNSVDYTGCLLRGIKKSYSLGRQKRSNLMRLRTALPSISPHIAHEGGMYIGHELESGTRNDLRLCLRSEYVAAISMQSHCMQCRRLTRIRIASAVNEVCFRFEYDC